MNPEQLRQLLCLYHDTSISTEQIAEQGCFLFDRATMLTAGVSYNAVCATGLDAGSLKAFGFNTLESYRQLGVRVDAIELRRVMTRPLPIVAGSRVRGAEAACKEFIQLPGGAVAIVGSTGEPAHWATGGLRGTAPARVRRHPQPRSPKVR